MKRNELLKAVLDMHVSDFQMQVKLLKPFEIDGYVYASDGTSIIRVPAEWLEESYKRDYECVHADSLYNESYQKFGSVSSMFLTESEGNVRLCDLIISSSAWNRICATTAILGLQGWEVSRNVAKGSIRLKNGDIDMIVMHYISDSFNRSVTCDDITWNPGIDEKAGSIALKALLKKKQEEEEAIAEAKKNKYDNIYEVTIRRIATMYVEAGSKEEAEKIASENMGEIDGDEFECSAIDCIDPEPRCAAYYMDTIYTDEREYDYDEYIDLAE